MQELIRQSTPRHCYALEECPKDWQHCYVEAYPLAKVQASPLFTSSVAQTLCHMSKKETCIRIP